MQASHRFAGLAFVALVISGLTVLTFAGVKPDQPIEILRNEFPSILPPGRSTFSFSVVARESVGLLEMRFAVLAPRSLVAEELVDPAWEQDAGSGPGDVLGNVRKLSWFMEATSQLGIEPETFDWSVSVEEERYDLLLKDYSVSIGTRLGPSLLGQNVTSNVPLMFAVIMNETRNQYFEGFPDFFVEPDADLRTLMISHNENETKYIADEEAQEGSGRLPMSQAPRGVVRIESVETDDTITVIIGVEPLQFEKDPAGPIALLQVIRIFLDGEAYGEPIVNVVR